jgi:fructoselysine-6-P-deglycase FrlB-like protein
VSEIEREIASQPACWATAVSRLPEVADVLPTPGQRVAVIGCGTSFHIARSYAALREETGSGETDAFAASEFPSGRDYDAIVAVSRSGTTTEVVRALSAVDRARSVAISAVPDTTVPDAAGRTIFLDFADERSVVQTRFATTVLAMLRAHVGQDLSPAIAGAERALAADLPANPTAFDRFVFLGHGWTVGLANEAALKMDEAAHANAESYPAMEYRHGPISAADPNTLVWVIGSPDVGVADDARAVGATVVTTSLDPMAELVLIHRTAVALAQARGLDPDNPRHLTRSVVLS